MLAPLYTTLILFVGLAQLDGVLAQNGCTKAQQNTIKNMRFRVSFTPSTISTVALSAWSDGGGPRHKIPSSSLSNPFAGREYGSGDRKTVYGTRAYGSGYPYGADNPTSLAGRPFPYGVWPISWGASYIGGGEYFSSSSSSNGEQLDLDFIRPGGPLGVVKLAPYTSYWDGVSGDEVYEMIGDRESLAFMISDLVDWCHVQPNFIRRFDPSLSSNTSSSTQPRPENVIQYYRASSFAISYSGYQNTFALGSSNPTTSQSFSDSSPLPSSISTSAFLHCINSTIGTALPIANPVEAKKPRVAPGAMIGFTIGGLVGILMACGLVVWVWSCVKKWRETRVESIPMVDSESMDRIVRDAGEEEGSSRCVSGEGGDKDDTPSVASHKKGEENTVYV